MIPCPRHARRWPIVAVLTAACIAATGHRAIAQPAAATTQPSSDVDAATKELMAAHGLFQRGLFKLAAQRYAGFLSDHPAHPQRNAALYALAVCEYREADYAKAAPLVAAALKDPAFAPRDEALAVLGHCEWEQKRYDAALAAYDELLSHAAADAKLAEPAALNRAQVLYAAGRAKDAAGAAGAFLDKYPTSDHRPAALYVLGLASVAAGDRAAALNAFDRLCKDHPTAPEAADALARAGRLLEQDGKHADAAARYARAAELAPADRKASVQVRLANAQLAAGHADEARKTFESVARDGSSTADEIAFGLVRCDMAEKRLEQARAALSALLDRQPPPANVVEIRFQRAECLLQLGQFADAAIEFQAVVDRPGDKDGALALDARYRRAYCLHQSGLYDKSHAACAELLAIKELPPTLRGATAELDADDLFRVGNYTDASRAFTNLAAQATDAGRRQQFQLRVAQCAYLAKDWGKAAELLKPLAEADAPEASFLLGDALLQIDEPREAAAAFRRHLDRAKAGADVGEARYKLAVALLRSGDEPAATATLADLAGGAGDSPWVQRGLVQYGQLLNKSGKADEARRALERVLSTGAAEESAAPALYLLGSIEFDAKRFDAAAERWKRLGETYPKHAMAVDAAFRYGVALQRAGKNDVAADALQHFAAEHAGSPNATEARRLAAECLSSAGKPGDAAAVLASLAEKPTAESDRVLYDLAWAQRSANKTADAQVTYRRLIREHAEGKLATAARVELAELLYDAGKFDEAAALLDAPLADKQLDAKLAAPAAYRLGWCAFKLQKWEKAATAFGRAAESAQGSTSDLAASALLQSGLAWAQIGRWEPAERALAEVSKRHANDPQAPLAMLKLGEVQAERGDFDASGQTYSAFLDKFPNDAGIPRAHFGLGWSLENRQHYDEARQSYGRAIASHDGEVAARAQFQIGETYLAEGKFEEALPALLAVDDVYAYPAWSARALLEAGRAFEQLKQPDRAKQQYAQLVAKYGDAPEAATAKERLGALAK